MNNKIKRYLYGILNFKYTKNISWLFVEKVFRIFLGLIVGIWVARYLGPSDYGIFNYVSSYIGILSVFGTFGLTGIVIRDLVENPEKRDIILGSSFALKLIGSTIVVLLVVVSNIFYDKNEELQKYMYIFVIGGVFGSIEVVSFYFDSIVKAKYVVIPNILKLFISSILKILGILFNASLEYFFYLVIVEGFILFGTYVYAYHLQNLSITKWKIDFIYMLKLAKEGWPIVLSSAITMVFLKMDQVMIYQFSTAEAVGQYAAAVRISTAFYFLPSIITISFYPAIVNAKKIDNTLYVSRLKSLFTLMIWTAIILVFPLAIFSQMIIDILYGVHFHDAGAILSVHLWTTLFVFMSSVSNMWFIIEKKQKISMLFSLVGLVVNLVLNYYFILRFSAIGAAYATLISYLVSTYVCLLCHNKTRTLWKISTKALFGFSNLFVQLKLIRPK